MKRRDAVFAALIACSAAAPAREAAEPTGGCAAATEPADQLVCRERGLAALDRKMAAALAARLSPLKADARRALLGEQEGWLGIRAMACALDIGHPIPASAFECLARLYRKRIEVIDETCRRDPTQTLAERLADEAADSVGHDMFPPLSAYQITIPKDLAIDPEPFELRSRGNLQHMILPDRASGGVAWAGAGSTHFAMCRVRGADGAWWAVSRAPDGTFIYLNLDDARNPLN